MVHHVDRLARWHEPLCSAAPIVPTLEAAARRRPPPFAAFAILLKDHPDRAIVVNIFEALLRAEETPTAKQWLRARLLHACRSVSLIERQEEDQAGSSRSRRPSSSSGGLPDDASMTGSSEADVCLEDERDLDDSSASSFGTTTPLRKHPCPGLPALREGDCEDDHQRRFRRELERFLDGWDLYDSHEADVIAAKRPASSDRYSLYMEKIRRSALLLGDENSLDALLSAFGLDLTHKTSLTSSRRHHLSIDTARSQRALRRLFLSDGDDIETRDKARSAAAGGMRAALRETRCRASDQNLERESLDHGVEEMKTFCLNDESDWSGKRAFLSGRLPEEKKEDSRNDVVAENPQLSSEALAELASLFGSSSFGRRSLESTEGAATRRSMLAEVVGSRKAAAYSVQWESLGMVASDVVRALATLDLDGTLHASRLEALDGLVSSGSDLEKIARSEPRRRDDDDDSSSEVFEAMKILVDGVKRPRAKVKILRLHATVFQRAADVVQRIREVNAAVSCVRESSALKRIMCSVLSVTHLANGRDSAAGVRVSALTSLRRTELKEPYANMLQFVAAHCGVDADILRRQLKPRLLKKVVVESLWRSALLKDIDELSDERDAARNEHQALIAADEEASPVASRAAEILRHVDVHLEHLRSDCENMDDNVEALVRSFGENSGSDAALKLFQDLGTFVADFDAESRLYGARADERREKQAIKVAFEKERQKTQQLIEKQNHLLEEERRFLSKFPSPRSSEQLTSDSSCYDESGEPFLQLGGTEDASRSKSASLRDDPLEESSGLDRTFLSGASFLQGHHSAVVARHRDSTVVARDRASTWRRAMLAASNRPRQQSSQSMISNRRKSLSSLLGMATVSKRPKSMPPLPSSKPAAPLKTSPCTTAGKMTESDGRLGDDEASSPKSWSGMVEITSNDSEKSPLMTLSGFDSEASTLRLTEARLRNLDIEARSDWRREEGRLRTILSSNFLGESSSGDDDSAARDVVTEPTPPIENTLASSEAMGDDDRESNQEMSAEDSAFDQCLQQHRAPQSIDTAAPRFECSLRLQPEIPLKESRAGDTRRDEGPPATLAAVEPVSETCAPHPTAALDDDDDDEDYDDNEEMDMAPPKTPRSAYSSFGDGSFSNDEDDHGDVILVEMPTDWPHTTKEPSLISDARPTSLRMRDHSSALQPFEAPSPRLLASIREDDDIHYNRAREPCLESRRQQIMRRHGKVHEEDSIIIDDWL